jgi:hypothetical protein
MRQLTLLKSQMPNAMPMLHWSDKVTTKNKCLSMETISAPSHRAMPLASVAMAYVAEGSVVALIGSLEIQESGAPWTA